MTENLKKFLEAISKDEALKAELAVFMKGNAQKDGKALLDFAASKGFTLTAEDFKQEAGELSNDELKAVAGGNNDCDIVQSIIDSNKNTCGGFMWL